MHTYIHKLVGMAVQSGIYGRDEYINVTKYYSQRYHTFTKWRTHLFLKRAKPMSIFGSIQTIFLIYVGVSVIAIVFGWYEVIWCRREEMWVVMVARWNKLKRRIFILWYRLKLMKLRYSQRSVKLCIVELLRKTVVS